MFAVKTKMVFNKRGDKKVAVIVARLKPDLHRIIHIPARLNQQFRFQLLSQKVVGLTLVNQDRQSLGY